MSKLRRPVIAMALLLCACSARPAERSGDRDVITEEELTAAGYSDLYTVVQSRRPQWLRQQSPQSINLTSQIQVYMDGLRLGGPDQLRQILPQSVSSVRFLSGIEATQRYGVDHGRGAILVTSRR